jgi:hypothetical protein
MPTLYAALAASVAGWLADDPLLSHLPLVPRLILGLALSAFAFAYVRRWLRDIKQGR